MDFSVDRLRREEVDYARGLSIDIRIKPSKTSLTKVSKNAIDVW